MASEAPSSVAPAVTAVICTRNRAARYLPRAVASLLAQGDDAGAFEVLVVDNDSSDPTRRVVDDLIAAAPPTGPRLRYAFEPRVGLSHARNRALAEARAPVVAYLDDDAVADPGWVAVIARRFAEDGALAALSGPVLPIWEAEPPAWLPDRLHGALGLRAAVDDGRLFGGNAAYRAATLRALGGFAPELGRRGEALLQGEDDDVAARLAAAGAPVAFEAAMLIRHHVPAARLRRAYLLRWALGSGRSQARIRLASDDTPARRARSAAGALLRGEKAALSGVLALLRGDRPGAFGAVFDLAREAGLATELAARRGRSGGEPV